MESWLATNEILATTTASATTPGYASGVVAAPTDGTTTGAMTLASLKEALKTAWAAGGSVTTILASATRKEDIDAFTSQATRQVDIGKTEQMVIHGAANVIVTSYGTHRVVLHRHVRTSVVLCVDPEFWAISFLERPFMEQLAKTGDGKKYQMLTEFGLVSRNEAASAKVVAIT